MAVEHQAIQRDGSHGVCRLRSHLQDTYHDGLSSTTYEASFFILNILNTRNILQLVATRSWMGVDDARKKLLLPYVTLILGFDPYVDPPFFKARAWWPKDGMRPSDGWLVNAGLMEG